MSRLVRRAMAAAAMVLAVGCCAAPGAWAAPLVVTVSGLPEQLVAGDRATLTASVTNPTGSDAQNVRVSFSLIADPFAPPPAILSAANCIGIGPSGQPPLTLSCLLAEVFPSGATGQITAEVSNPGLGELPVDIAATPESGADPSGFLRWLGSWEPKADTKLELSASAESVAYGAPVTIRGLVTNTTTAGTAYGAAVRFSIPAGVEVVSRPADCTGTALNLVCPVGDLGPQLTAQRELTLRSTTEGAFTVLGTVSWARPDTTPVDTQGQVSVTVLPPPDTTPVPEPTPTKPAAPRPVTVSASGIAQGVPASGRCVRSRRLSIVLRSRGAWDPVKATIRVTGRRKALTLKGARAQRPFTLTLPRRGRVTLRLDVTYDNGRRYKATRSFRRC